MIKLKKCINGFLEIEKEDKQRVNKVKG